MKRSGSFIGAFVAILLLFNSGYLCAQQLYSEVSLDKSSVYVGEPLKVKISVYTSTWFTRGIDLGNIKVNGAFTVFFRPVSTSVVKEGQKYAGVELIYHVFPYGEKDLVFPALDIAVETPPEGEYKGVRRVVKSAEKRIRVKPYPSGFTQDDWLVSNGLSLSDQWQGKLNDVKVGDVLVRQISREAQGTVAELIPPIQWDTIRGVSMYQARSAVNNAKSRSAIIATRTETMRFLFEEEGEVSIPAMAFSWYDPLQKELFKRTLKELRITVQPNPDLGVLASVRDSLLAVQAMALEETSEEEALTIGGLPPEQFALMLILAGFLAYILQVLVRKMLRMIKARRQGYRHSEAYYFHLFIKAAKGKHPAAARQALYRWIDELKLHEPTIAFFARNYGSETLQEEAQALAGQGQPAPSACLNISIKRWQQARNAFLSAKSDSSSERLSGWINPG